MFSIFNAQTITFSFYQFNRIPGVHKSAIFYHPAPMMLLLLSQDQWWRRNTDQMLSLEEKLSNCGSLIQLCPGEVTGTRGHFHEGYFDYRRELQINLREV